MCESAVRHPRDISVDPFGKVTIYVRSPLRAPTKSKHEDGAGDLGHAIEIQYPYVLANLFSRAAEELSIIHYGGKR